MKSLGILLSGRGSNFVAIADSIDAGRIPDARIAVVISNKADAPGYRERPAQRGLNALVIPSKGKPREEHDREVVAALKQAGVDLICLAGYMRLLSPWFVQQFPQRILNIHPSLLPAFPGLEAQEQAFAYGVKVSGCTVHFVDEELDHGAIIVQKTVPVLDARRRTHARGADPGAGACCLYGSHQCCAGREVRSRRPKIEAEELELGSVSAWFLRSSPFSQSEAILHFRAALTDFPVRRIPSRDRTGLHSTSLPSPGG